jgi:hypothetical protein
MEKHDFIHMLNCRLEQEQGKPASLSHCEGCRAKSFCEKEDLPSLLNLAIYELEQTLPEERSTLEFGTYTGIDFKHGLRHGMDYSLKIEIRGGVYRVFARNAPIQSQDTLVVYYHLADFINDWSLFT